MSFDGNGNYIVPAGSDAVTGSIIASGPYNMLLRDLEASLTQCLLRSGQSAATNNVPMGGYKLVGLAAGVNAGDSVRFEQLYSMPKGSYTASGLPLTFAPTTIVDASLTNVVELLPMTANMSLGITNPQAGQTLNIRFQQDGVGGRSVTLGTAIFAVAGAVDTQANKASWLLITYSARSQKWEGIWSLVP